MFEGNFQLSYTFSKKLLGNNYYRINPKMDEDIAMDDTEAINYLINLAKEYDIKQCVNWLNDKWNKI